MGTEDGKSLEAILRALDSHDWSTALEGVARAEQWCQRTIAGDPDLDIIVARLVRLAGHVKWEVRRAVANVAAQVQHPAFEAVLARLVADDNGRVRQAAENAALRRRDSRHASTLGKQHVERLNTTLDDIEARFGPRGRDAVRRAADQVANTFARELYHEVIRLVSPLAVSADRLREQLSAETVSLSGLREEAERVRRRVSHLRSVLDAMRAYTEQPALTFGAEDLREVVEEAAALAKGKSRGDEGPPLELSVPAGLFVDMSRSRLVQALTNVLENAIESYDGLGRHEPVVVRADRKEGLATIVIQDRGCGMAAEARQDATTLFATSKKNGTGFGLPLAVKIVESEHGGRLDIESTPDEGTTVRITMRVLR
ncbi:MAG: GHKL domain-containing protein [Acidobacteria bacterium]|nr:GHKL domain-containing protein [Acidobacteriota bacterium]